MRLGLAISGCVRLTMLSVLLVRVLLTVVWSWKLLASTSGTVVIGCVVLVQVRKQVLWWWASLCIGVMSLGPFLWFSRCGRLQALLESLSRLTFLVLSTWIIVKELLVSKLLAWKLLEPSPIVTGKLVLIVWWAVWMTLSSSCVWFLSGLF